MMNRVSHGGLVIAQQLATVYEANQNVIATVLSGSVARGHADQYSDLEIGVFWMNPPTDQERQDAVSGVGGDLWSFTSYVVEPERVVSEKYGLNQVTVKGIQHTGTLMIDTKHLTVAAMERCLTEVLDQLDTTPSKHILLAAVQDAIPLFGEKLIQSWQAQASTYPDHLAIKVIQENLWCGPWFIPQAYVQRDDRLVLVQHFVWMQQSILKILAGLNRLYFPSAEYKWMSEFIDRLALAPSNLANRMKQVFQEIPSAAIQEMLEIVNETVALVEQHLPAVNHIAMFDGHPEINTEWARKRWKEQEPYILMQAIQGLPV